jgi:hypothetical protein
MAALTLNATTARASRRHLDAKRVGSLGVDHQLQGHPTTSLDELA